MADARPATSWAGRLGAVVRVARAPVVVDVLVLAAGLVDALSGVRYATGGGQALAVLAVGALVLRRRWPLVAWLATVPAAFDGVAVVPSVLALYALAARAERQWVLVVAGLAMFLSFGDYVTDASIAFDDALLETVYGLFFALGPIALGLLVRTRRELSARVDELDRARDQEREQAAAAAVARERAMLAREMHDVVSHQVSLIAVQAGAQQVAARDAETREFARTVRELSVATLDELREMVGVLRAAGDVAVTVHPQPVLADLPALIGASGLTVRSEVAVPGDLPLPVQRALFRFVQEGLTNVRKHAPGADVVVRATCTPHEVVAEVRNGPAPEGARGAAPSLPGSGVGILGLRERAELLGGDVTAASDGGGFVLAMRLPLRPAG